MNNESGQPFDNKQLARLHRRARYASYLGTAACLLVAAAVVWVWPQAFLWPEATGGTARHWIAGAIVVLLCTAVAVTTEEVLQAGYVGAANGHGGYLWSAVARRTGYLGLVTALLVWPLWKPIVHVWQANDFFLIRPVFIELLVRTIPVMVLVLIAKTAEWWFTSLRRRLAYPPDSVTAEVTSTTSVEPADTGNGAAADDHPQADLYPVGPPQQS